MITSWLEEILTAAKTSVQPGALPGQLESLPGRPRLPDGYLALLRHSNGVLLYDGYFRVLGLNGSAYGDMLQWNAPETWKFAWPADLSEFLCFAETAWGDQYAFEISSLGRGEQAVVFLDALRMKPRVVAQTFNDFAERYLVRNSKDPYDSVLRAARAKLGVLLPGIHLAFSPPTLLTGEENLDQIVKLDAREAMILNGDLWTQLHSAPEGAAVAGFEAFEDDVGRPRMRVIWT